MISDIEEARERVAARWIQTYTKNAIINGEWDLGRLVKEELEQVRFERVAMRDSKVEE